MPDRISIFFCNRFTPRLSILFLISACDKLVSTIYHFSVGLKKCPDCDSNYGVSLFFHSTRSVVSSCQARAAAWRPFAQTPTSSATAVVSVISTTTSTATGLLSSAMGISIRTSQSSRLRTQRYLTGSDVARSARTYPDEHTSNVNNLPQVRRTMKAWLYELLW